MAALAVLGLAACAAQPPPPPPPPTERVSQPVRRRPVVRARNNVPATPAPTRQDEAPAPTPASAPARPAEEATAVSAETRQERDRRAFVVCNERYSGAGPGLQTVASCLRTYGSTGVVPSE